ncbi:hypothetical protein M9458_023869, partial [Cirrhinus mrigala]
SPSVRFYAFPTVSLIPPVIGRIKGTGCSLLLVAPLWKNQTWFPELVQLTAAPLWPILLRRDLLSQAKGMFGIPDQSCEAF